MSRQATWVRRWCLESVPKPSGDQNILKFDSSNYSHQVKIQVIFLSLSLILARCFLVGEAHVPNGSSLWTCMINL